MRDHYPRRGNDKGTIYFLINKFNFSNTLLEDNAINNFKLSLYDCMFNDYIRTFVNPMWFMSFNRKIL